MHGLVPELVPAPFPCWQVAAQKSRFVEAARLLDTTLLFVALALFPVAISSTPLVITMNSYTQISYQ